jgi:hypothetical protein
MPALQLPFSQVVYRPKSALRKYFETREHGEASNDPKRWALRCHGESALVVLSFIHVASAAIAKPIVLPWIEKTPKL